MAGSICSITSVIYSALLRPGGTPAATYLHLARTVSRRAERLMAELAATEGETVAADSDVAGLLAILGCQ